MSNEISISSEVENKTALARFFPWYCALTVFYSAWSYLVSRPGAWDKVLDHWGISLSMAAGSYFAGSTPMGGGTVGFPVLVMLFNGPATLGRDFSFAIQSIGMVSASFYIFCARRPVEGPMLSWSIFGSLIGTPAGILFIAPLLSELYIKLVFAVVWATFGLLHFWKLEEIASNHGMLPTTARFDHLTGFFIGLLGGATVASVTGVGVDMILYAFLVLVCRADLKIAIPTSVVLMATTSVVGLLTKVVFMDLEPEVYPNWLAASPVVALGAPLGAWIVERMDRRPTLVIVSCLCLAQFGWTLIKEWASLRLEGVLVSLMAVAVCFALIAWLHRLGSKLKIRQS